MSCIIGENQAKAPRSKNLRPEDKKILQAAQGVEGWELGSKNKNKTQVRSHTNDQDSDGSGHHKSNTGNKPTEQYLQDFEGK